MNTMNLNAAGVMELNAVEMREIDGGWLKEVTAALVDLYENWETYKASFVEGYKFGYKTAL